MALERTIWRLRAGIKAPYAAAQDVCADYFAPPASLKIRPATKEPAHPQMATSPELQAAAASIVSGAQAASAKRLASLKQNKHSARQTPTPPPTPVTGAGMSASLISAPKMPLTLYISNKLSLSYMPSLKEFLARKGVTVVDFAPGVEIKRPAAVLLGAGDMPPPGCLCFLPDENKAALWSFLRREFVELQ